MLSQVGTPQPIQAAAGQYVRASCQFQSSTPLAGQTVRLNPGFTSSQSPPPGAIAWALPFPALAGTYPMTFNAPAIWRNYKAELQVINGTNFRINLDFFVGSGSDYVGGAAAPDNGNPFGTIPNAVTLAVTTDSTAFCTIPIQATAFGSGNMSLAVNYGTNIRVDMATTSTVSGETKVGIFRTDSVGNVSDMPTDVGLNYSTLAIGPAGDLGFPEDCFTSKFPFQSNGTGPLNAFVNLDNSCLVIGGTYRFYVVYNDGNAWRSEVSEEISLGSNIPVVSGNVSYGITDGSTSWETGCLTNVPPCKDLLVTVTMDGDSYNSALSDAGISGAMTDYFASVKVSVQSSFSGAVTGSLQNAISDNLASGIAATFSYAAEPGNKYLVFAFTFTFSDRVDTILVPVQISTVDYQDLAVPSTFCAEDGNPISIELPAAIGTAMTTQYDAPNVYAAAEGISIAGTTVTIDPATIPIGTQRCFEICSEEAPATQPCVCECECVTVNYTGTACNDDNTYTAEIKALGNLDIKSLKITSNNGQTLTIIGGGNTATVSGTSGDRFPISFFVQGLLTLNNGCIYTLPLRNFELSFRQGAGNEPCSLTIPIEVCVADCDCDDVPPAEGSCENYISISQTCEDGEITFAHSEQLASPVATDIKECSLDGVTWGACQAVYTESEVHARRIVTFTDSCPPIQAVLIGRCQTEVNCINSASLDVVKTDVLLTLTVVGDYTSSGAVENIFYSINGGSTYLPYTVPVALTGSEQIRVYSQTTFTDGCPDVVTPVVDATGTPLGDNPFVTYCDENGNITGFALAVIEQGASTTLYYDSSMIQRATVPPGEPCDNTVPCATCP